MWTDRGWLYPVWTERGWEQAVWGAPPPGFAPALPDDQRLPPEQHTQPLPYNLLLRTSRARGWHFFAGVALALAVMLGISVVVFGVCAGIAALIDDPAIVSDTDVEDFTGPFGLLVTNLMLASLIPGCLLAVRAVHRERPGWLNSVTGRLRPRLLVTSLVLTVVIQAVSFALYFLLDALGVDIGGESTEGGWAGWTSFLALMVVILCTTPLQAAGEEYLFRGYFMQAFGIWTRSPWIPAVISGLAFAAAHGPQDPWLFSDRFLFGMAAWWLTVRTGGLEAAIAFHVVTNLYALTLAAAADELDSTLVISDVPAAAALLDMATILVIAWVLDRNARRLGVATRTVVSDT